MATGLFSSPKRFAEYYQKPVEKNGDKGQLDKLRRRVRPLMMRRTKDQVIQDLPPKQEQILEVVLNPRHQKVYQTHLQRERQKIRGTTEDVTENRFTLFHARTLPRRPRPDPSALPVKVLRNFGRRHLLGILHDLENIGVNLRMQDKLQQLRRALTN